MPGSFGGVFLTLATHYGKLRAGLWSRHKARSTITAVGEVAQCAAELSSSVLRNLLTLNLKSLLLGQVFGNTSNNWNTSVAL